MTTSDLQTTRHILSAHVAGELDLPTEVEQQLAPLAESNNPLVIEVREELLARHVRRQGARHTDAWLFERELQLTLQAI